MLQRQTRGVSAALKTTDQLKKSTNCTATTTTLHYTSFQLTIYLDHDDPFSTFPLLSYRQDPCRILWFLRSLPTTVLLRFLLSTGHPTWALDSEALPSLMGCHLPN